MEQLPKSTKVALRFHDPNPGRPLPLVDVALVQEDGTLSGRLQIAYTLGISQEDLVVCLRAAAEGIRARRTDSRIVVPLN